MIHRIRLLALMGLYVLAASAWVNPVPAEENNRAHPRFLTQAKSYDFKDFTRVVEDEGVFLHDGEGRRMFQCLTGRGFTPDNVRIDRKRGLILRATVTGKGEPGTQVPPEHTHGGGVMTGKHYSGEFSFWSFAPDPPTNYVRVDIYATIPRPLGAKLAVWSFADDWYEGGGSLISMEMDMIEAGGHPKEWIDGSRDGLFKYHPNIHSWFGGGSPWGHKSVQHMEPKTLDFGPEEKEHKLSWEWENGPTREEKVLRYLIDDQVVYKRSVAEMKEKHPVLNRGGKKGVECTLSAREIADFMWDKPQNLQIWYGADRDFFLSGVPQYGDAWPSEMTVRRMDVYRSRKATLHVNDSH
ncbi:hypothetical protein GF373_06085 [bacterium]|nr:hypothetical protein [bacterium]